MIELKDIHDLRKLPEAINGFIEDEMGERTTQLKELKTLKLENRSTINKLEDENKKLKEKSNLLTGLINELTKLDIIEVIEESDSGYDEYGNGGGYWRMALKYKDKIIFEDGESF